MRLALARLQRVAAFGGFLIVVAACSGTATPSTQSSTAPTTAASIAPSAATSAGASAATPGASTASLGACSSVGEITLKMLYGETTDPQKAAVEATTKD